MSKIEFSIRDKPSHSKGWGRYSANQDGRKVIQARTGNEWVSADHSGEAEAGSQFTLTLQVMLRVGKGRTAREQISVEKHVLIVEDGATCEINFAPGSQGLRLAIAGARKVA